MIKILIVPFYRVKDMFEEDALMVVDDDPSILEVLKDYFSDEGFHVWAVNSGELALQTVLTKTPRLILLDIRMPGMNVFEVCRRLKALKETKGIPVIFVSGMQNHQERIKGFSLGAVDIICKPFQFDELLARVSTHLELSHLRAGLETQVALRTAQLRRSFEKMQKVLSETVKAIATVVETRDPYTAGHQRRTADLARTIATEMGLPIDQIEGLSMTATIHDI